MHRYVHMLSRKCPLLMGTICFQEKATNTTLTPTPESKHNNTEPVGSNASLLLG